MPTKTLKEEVTASGHENIEATHPTTLEITKERGLSRRGDCIIAVGADKSLADFSEEFKERLAEAKREADVDDRDRRNHRANKCTRFSQPDSYSPNPTWLLEKAATSTIEPSPSTQTRQPMICQGRSWKNCKTPSRKQESHFEFPVR